MGVGCRWDARVGDAYLPWDFDPTDHPPEVAVVMGGILAANPHNTQPWLFRIAPDQIDVFADLDQSLGAMDPDHREMHIGLGCAVENMVVTAQVVGRQASVVWMPDPIDPTWVATVLLEAQPPRSSSLFDALPTRRTDRGPYDPDAPIPAALREAIVGAGDANVAVHWFDSAAVMEDIALRTLEATEAIVADEEMNEASHSWWRQGPDDIERYRSGLTMDATGASGCTRFMGKHLSNPDADRAGSFWVQATERRQTTASAWVLLSSGDLEDRQQQLEVGRAYQRIHLTAESEGFAMQPMNQVLERRDREHFDGAVGPFDDWVQRLVPGRIGQMLFRVGVPERAAGSSPRKPLEWVVVP